MDLVYFTKIQSFLLCIILKPKTKRYSPTAPIKPAWSKRGPFFMNLNFFATACSLNTQNYSSQKHITDHILYFRPIFLRPRPMMEQSSQFFENIQTQ